MQTCGDRLTGMRDRAPLVHNITNFVAMNVMANVLLAAGASPAMVHSREEVAEFAALSQALTVNIGTASTEWGLSMVEAARVMQKAGRPWVFDPVGVGATKFRQALSDRLLDLHPTVVRGNASEIMTLAGLEGRHGCGGRRHGCGCSTVLLRLLGALLLLTAFGWRLQ